MAVYLVSYELKKESSAAAYRPLWDALEALNSHKVQRSVWLVATTSNQGAVHDHLKQDVDDNDRLVVSKVNRNGYAYSGAMPGTKKFLADYL